MQNTININVDFGGGLDLVFDGKTDLKLELPIEATVQTVISQLANKYANHKKDMFAINDQMYPFTYSVALEFSCWWMRPTGNLGRKN